MNDYMLLKRGLEQIIHLIRSSRKPEIKELSSYTNCMTGSPYLQMVNKTVTKEDGKVSYSALRLYAPTSSGNYPWFDMTYRFSEFKSKPNETRIIVDNENNIHTWVNMLDCYIEFFIEKAPNIETPDNTKSSSISETEVIETLVDEANYFALRCQDLNKKPILPVSDLQPPPKNDTPSWIDACCLAMSGN